MNTEFFGYFAIALLGIGYSLVPAAMWPSVPKIIPEKNLGTAYSLIYWIQNMGMLLVPIFIGMVLDSYVVKPLRAVAESLKVQPQDLPADLVKPYELAGAVNAEYIFIGLGIVAVVVSLLLAASSRKNPQLELDLPNKKK